MCVKLSGNLRCLFWYRVSLHSLGLSNCVDQDGFKLKETGLLCLLSADIRGMYHHAWPPAFLSPSPMHPLCSCFSSEFTVPWGGLRVVVPLSRAHCSLVSQRSNKSHFPPKWMLSVPPVVSSDHIRWRPHLGRAIQYSSEETNPLTEHEVSFFTQQKETSHGS